MLRLGTPMDAGELLAVYAPYVEKTAVTFETRTPALEEFAGRIDEDGRYPWVLAFHGGELLGYACAHPFSGRAAYGWTAETSIYLREDRRGLGVGRKLYTALLELLRLQGYGCAVAVLTDPNAPSEAFHEKLGFSICGRLPRAGYKAGRWWGVSWWQKELQAPGFVPGPILPLPALSRGTVERVLRENS